MAWLVDSANNLYLLFGIIAAGFVVAWRFSQRNKYLGYAAGTLAAMGLIWLLTQFFTSDRKDIENHIREMSRAVVDGRTDDLFKHIARDFRYKDMTRDVLHQQARAAVVAYKINDVRIRNFKMEEVSREKKFAKARFDVSVNRAGNEHSDMFHTQADFVLEDNQWKLKTLRFYNPFVDQDRELDLPFPR